MVALGAPAPALILASSGVGLYAICVVRGVGFAIFTIAGTVSTGEIAPPSRHRRAGRAVRAGAAIPAVALVPLSVLLLHNIGFWPVAVLATLPVPGALFAVGSGWRRSAGGHNDRAGQRVIERGDERAGELPGGRVGDRAGERAGGRVGDRAGERAGGRVGDRAGERAGGRVGDRAGERAGERVGERARGRDASSPRSAAAAAVRRVLAPAAVLCALTVAGGAVVTILPIARSGFVATAGLAVFGAAAAGAHWQAGVRVRRHGVAVLLVSACVIAVAGLLTLAGGLSGGDAVPVLVGCTVAGVGYGAAQSLTLVSAFARTRPRSRATASAVWNVAFDSGTAVGAVLIGALTATWLGIWGAFAVLAALVLASVPLAITSGRA